METKKENVEKFVRDKLVDVPGYTANAEILLVQKKAIPVKFEFAKTDGVCKTLEGEVAYKSGDAIMTGVKGENWPISREKFEKSYDIIGEGQATKKPVLSIAFQSQKDTVVPVGWQDSPLKGPKGHYILVYGDKDYGVVEPEIFNKTYDVVDRFLPDRNVVKSNEPLSRNER